MSDPRMMKRMQKEAFKVAKLTLENDGYYVDPKTLDKGKWDVYIQVGVFIFTRTGGDWVWGGDIGKNGIN